MSACTPSSYLGRGPAGVRWRGEGVVLWLWHPTGPGRGLGREGEVVAGRLAAPAPAVLLGSCQQELVYVLHAPHTRLQLLGSLLRALLLLLDQPDLVVDGVELFLQHTGQGLGVRLPPRTQQIGHNALAVIGVAVDAAVVAPAGVGVLGVVGVDLLLHAQAHAAPEAGRRAPGQRAEAGGGVRHGREGGVQVRQGGRQIPGEEPSVRAGGSGQGWVG